MVELKIYQEILDTFEKNKKIVVIGPILSGLTFTYNRLVKEVSRDELCHVNGQLLTERDERELASELERMGRRQLAKTILLVPEYHLKYVMGKLPNGKEVDQLIRTKVQVIPQLVTEEEAHEIAKEHLNHKKELSELREDSLFEIEDAWVEHARRTCSGRYLDNYETYLPALITSEIDETSKRWKDFKPFGCSGDAEFVRLEKRRLKKKRREFSAIVTASSISAAMLSVETRSIATTIQNFIGMILPAFTPVAFGATTALLTPSLFRDIRKWWKGGRAKVRLEEFLTVIRYWNEFTDEERRLLCYELDQKNKQKPGRSYEDLSRVLGGFDAKKMEEFEKKLDLLQNDFQNKLDERKIDLDFEMKRLEEKLGKRFDELEKISDEIELMTLAIHEDFEKLTQDIEELDIRSCEQCGLSCLDPKYFEKHKSTDYWKNGFPFELPDIMENHEFRRDVVNDIESRLDRERMLIIVGETGTSKSIMLKLIICSYYRRGYRILYDFSEEIRNPEQLRSFIEKLVDRGESVLVAVDNGHLPDKAAVFYIMKEFLSYAKLDRVRFIIAATLPEFDDLFHGRSDLVKESYRSALAFFIYSEYRLLVEYFDLDEIKRFVRSYMTISDLELDSFARNTLSVTRGNPFLVFLRVFGEGLGQDVQNRWNRCCTWAREHGEPVGELITAALVCSLFDIAKGGVSDELLKGMELQLSAEKLNRRVLYRNEDGIWSTLHYSWASAFFQYLFPGDVNDRVFCIENERHLKDALGKIYGLQNKDVTFSAIDSLFKLAQYSYVPLEVAEIVWMPDYISGFSPVILWMTSIGPCFAKLQKFDEAVAYQLKTFKGITPTEAWSNIASQANHNGFLNEAIACYDKALEADPNDADAWEGKGMALNKKELFGEAIACYDKALEIDPNHTDAWKGKGAALNNKGLPNEAIACYDKALEIAPDDAEAWTYKGIALCQNRLVDEGMGCFDKALKINPNYSDAWVIKGRVLQYNKLFDEAIVCYDRALEIDPSNAEAWDNKGATLLCKNSVDDAIVCFDRALKVKPDYPKAWENMGLALVDKKLFEMAISCYDKALKLDPRNANTWRRKGEALSDAHRYLEAETAYDRAIEQDGSEAIYYNNRAYLRAAHIRGSSKAAAEEDIRKAVRIAPSFSTAWITYAEICALHGSKKEGLRILDEALKSGNINLHDLKSEIRDELNNPEVSICEKELLRQFIKRHSPPT